MKKKTIVPLIVFLLGICLVGLIVYKIDSHETEQQHIKAQLNATTYGERIKNEIKNGIAITDTLKQVLISENGKISQFDTIAENIMSDVIESIQLAPDGNVTDIYPSEGTEASKISALSDFGYEYRLSKTDAPWSDTYKVVYQSDDQLTHTVSYGFTIGEEHWTLEVAPESGWRDLRLLVIVGGMFTAVVLLFSGLTRVWLVSKENKNKFQILAHTDSLTDIYNRYGFDELAEKMITKNPKAHFVAALLDIDDFKFINDIYGHVYGDRALKSLTDSMKAFFPKNTLLGRNGGDEFCILLPDHTYKEAGELLLQFTKLPKTFSCKGKEYPFFISLGYAEYPTFASSRSQLMRCADAALYEIKLHGKNGCMAYREGLRSGVRKQLGFAFKDISEHLPGAFIIYRADKDDDELLYANHEFLQMTGYKTIDKLFSLTNRSFHNLIREDEQQQIEASIWKQIDAGNKNDYIHFHLRKADGTYLSVLDHGRIVDSQQYGRVFYVLFMDWEAMHVHYSDKFSG